MFEETEFSSLTRHYTENEEQRPTKFTSVGINCFSVISCFQSAG